MSRWNELAHGTEDKPVVAGLNKQSLRLHVVATGLYLKTADGLGLRKRIHDVAGFFASERAVVVAQDGSRHYGLGKGRFGVHGKGGDVGKIAIETLNVGQREGLWATLRHRDDGVAPHHALHRLLGLDPRSAGKSEAVADVDAHLQAERVGLLQGEVDHLPEAGRQLLRLTIVLGPLLNAANGHEIAPAQSGIFHGLQVGTYTFGRHSSIHPVPKGPWTTQLVGLLQGLGVADNRGKEQ